MQEEAARDVGKPLPQQGRQKHQVVVMHQHDISFLVDACHRLQEELVCVSIRLTTTRTDTTEPHVTQLDFANPRSRAFGDGHDSENILCKIT